MVNSSNREPTAKKDVILSASLFGATMGAMVGCLFWVSMGVGFQQNVILFGFMFACWVVVCTITFARLGAKHWRVLHVEPTAQLIHQKATKSNFVA